MKKTGKIVLGIFIGIILIFMILISGGVLVEKGGLKSEPQEPEVRMEYTPKRMGEPVEEEATADSEYYPSPELAMKNSDFQVDDEDVYQKNIDEVIAKFENEKYAAIYFRSIKDKNTECFTFAGLKRKGLRM